MKEILFPRLPVYNDKNRICGSLNTLIFMNTDVSDARDQSPPSAKLPQRFFVKTTHTKAGQTV